MSEGGTLAGTPPAGWDRTERTRDRLCVALLVLAGLLVYARGLRAPFIFDDLPSIVENPNIRSLRRLGTVLVPEHAPGPARRQRPLFTLTLAVNYALGGLDPRGYHAFNLALHLLNAILLFDVVRRSLRAGALVPPRASTEPSDRGIALAVALLFTVHTLQTEAVNYVHQRTELLMAFFLLLTLDAAIRGFAAPAPARRAWHAVAVAACVLGMASKEAMAAAPLVVLFWDRAFVSGSLRAALRRHPALHAQLAATWLVLLALIVLLPEAGSPVTLAGSISPLAYLRTQAGVVLRYLRLAIWPAPLSISYDWPIAERWTDAAPAGLAVLALLGATVWALARAPRAGFLGAAFFLLLAPSSSVVPIVTEVIAERRMYLPLAALLALVVAGAQRALPRRARPLVLAACVIPLGSASVVRLGAYASTVAIWSDASSKFPGSAQAHTGYGMALAEAGRIDAAIAEYRCALAIAPAYGFAWNDLGNAYGQQGDSGKAIACYRAALLARPDYAAARENLAATLLTLGRAEDAALEYRTVLAGDPGRAGAHLGLGRALVLVGRLDAAAGEMEEALRLDPSLDAARAELAALRARLREAR